MIRPPSFRRRRPRPWWLLALALVACSGDQTRHAATASIVTAGGALAVVQSAHQRAYVAATDALRARIVAAHGTLADYDAQVAPIDAAFAHRGEAIEALDDALYTAAAVVNAATKGNADAWVAAARELLSTLDRATQALSDGAVLAPVAIPPEVREVIDALRAIAEAGNDH